MDVKLMMIFSIFCAQVQQILLISLRLKTAVSLTLVPKIKQVFITKNARAVLMPWQPCHIMAIAYSF